MFRRDSESAGPGYELCCRRGRESCLFERLSDYAESIVDARPLVPRADGFRGGGLSLRRSSPWCSSRLGIANIATRARWNEVEDGVYWDARPEGVTRRRRCGRARRAPAPESLRATSCSPSTVSRSSSRGDVIAFQHQAGAQAPLSYTLLRLGARQALDVTLAPASPSGSMYFVLAGVGLFTLLVGASVRLRRPARPGDAAFLLAVRRVLRRLHVLVQRSVRSARLDVLLGRRRRDGAAAAAAAALHAGVPRAAAVARRAADADAAAASCTCRRSR